MPVSWLSVLHCKQEFNYSCVAACVRMVLGHYGCPLTEDEIRQLLGTGPHGTVARNIALLASVGFDVQIGRSTFVDLAAALAAGVPPIVFLETSLLDYWSLQASHVAVLVGLDVAAVYLNDPAFDTAPQQTSLTSFDLSWAANQYYAAFIRPRP